MPATRGSKGSASSATNASLACSGSGSIHTMAWLTATAAITAIAVEIPSTMTGVFQLTE